MLDFFWKSDIYSMGLSILCMIGNLKDPNPYWNQRSNINYDKLK